MAAPPQYQTDALARAQGADILLNPRGSTPPVNAYIQADTFLQVKCWNAAPGIIITVQCQLLRSDGSISRMQWTLAPPSTRAATSFFLPLTEGFLLAATVNAGLTGFPNRCWVQLRLNTAGSGLGNVFEVLTQGYTSGTSWPAWPGGVMGNSMDGNGGVNDVTGTLPGAGAEISETVPTNAVWQLKSFTFKLTTSATVANRIPHLIIDDGTNILLDSPAPSVLAASLTNRYVTGDNAIAAAAIDATQWLQSVAAMRLLPGYRIRTLTTNLQAGDQYTAPQYVVTEWLQN
jgi:hypothetical protein